MRLLSDLHENAVAADIGGRRSLNSGAGVKKSDVHNEFWAVECKATIQKGFVFRVTPGMLMKASREAKTRDKLPAMSFATIEGDLKLSKSLRITSLVYLVPTAAPGLDQHEGFEALVWPTDQPIRIFNSPTKFRIKGKTGVFQWWTLMDRRTGSMYLKTQKSSLSGSPTASRRSKRSPPSAKRP